MGAVQLLLWYCCCIFGTNDIRPRAISIRCLSFAPRPLL